MEDNKENSRWTNWKELSPLRPDSVIVWKAKWWLSICHLGKLRHQRMQWLTPCVITTATFADRLVMSWHKSQIRLLANNIVGSLSHRSDLRNRYDLPVYLNTASMSVVNIYEDSLMFITGVMSLLWQCHNSVLLVYVYPFRVLPFCLQGMIYRENNRMQRFRANLCYAELSLVSYSYAALSLGDVPGKQCGHTGGRFYLKKINAFGHCH